MKHMFFLSCLYLCAGVNHPIIAENTGCEWTVGTWRITFNPEVSPASLTCVHPDTDTTVSGPLTFLAVNAEGNPEVFTVVPARDSVSSRLALRDQKGDIQGYVVFTATAIR